MTGRDRWLADRRSEAWAFGIRHREDLITRYMADRNLCDRPLLKVAIDEFIEGVQEARLMKGVLPLDRFGQTESIRGRLEVTINSRIETMPKVKDAEGVEYLTKWHESVHVACDFDGESAGPREQDCLPGFEVNVPTLIVCRGTDASTG